MANIFISYSREDHNKVKPLAKALEKEGWTVWWDPNIPPGKDFDDVIDKELSNAGCVIVIWSKKSVKSKYVKGEAREGLNRDILVPVAIESNIEPPFDFRSTETVSLIEWDGSKTSPELDRIFDGIKSIIDATQIKEKERQRKETATPSKATHLEKQRLWSNLTILAAVIGAIAVVIFVIIQIMPLKKTQENDIVIAPQPEQSKFMRVLVDASKGGGVWWYPQAPPHFDPELPHQGKAIADHLKQKQWLVRELPRGLADIGRELESAQIVIRFGDFNQHNPAEIEAYKQFVEQGGSLLLLFKLSGDDEIDRLTDAFGIRVRRINGTLTDWPNKAKPLNWLDDHPASPALGEMPFGKGKVVFLSSSGAGLLLTIEQPFVDNVFALLSMGLNAKGPWLLKPHNGAEMGNGCSRKRVWEFDWMDTPGASHYQLFVIGRHASFALIDNSDIINSSYRDESSGYITPKNVKGWRWKVRAKIEGAWGKWSEERTFDVEACK